jgi:hypothetical protein
MQTNIFWTGRKYYSFENCICNFNESGNRIESTIVGLYQQQLYKVEYMIETNAQWETTSIVLATQLNDKRSVHRYDGDGNGNWKQNGKAVSEFKGCVDVDLPLSPFTNTLPIRRLGLAVHESVEITVMYLDILENSFRPVRQKYERRSGTEYKYENIPNDFEALITVDLDGLVVDYPELFTRTACVESKYDLTAASRLASMMKTENG